MKIYLDNCSLQRPLDDQAQPRIERETKAVIAILSLCETESSTLVSSEALQLEIAENSDSERQETTLGILKIARETIAINTEVAKRASEIKSFGVKAFDALHLASAEAAQVQYFCTCDDRLLKKSKAIADLKVKVVSPIELFEEISR